MCDIASLHMILFVYTCIVALYAYATRTEAHRKNGNTLSSFLIRSAGVISACHPLPSTCPAGSAVHLRRSVFTARQGAAPEGFV